MVRQRLPAEQRRLRRLSARPVPTGASGYGATAAGVGGGPQRADRGYLPALHDDGGATGVHDAVAVFAACGASEGV